MYIITIVGIKQKFEQEYFMALRSFIDFVETTENKVQLIHLVDGREELVNEGYTANNGEKQYLHSIIV